MGTIRIVTTDSVPGYVCVEDLGDGPVMGKSSFSRDEDPCLAALADLRRAAGELGADAVVGLRMLGDPRDSVIAYGTAMRIEVQDAGPSDADG